jgi:hypothetical protein
MVEMDEMPLGVGTTHSHIREILTKAAGSKESRAVAQIITGNGGTDTPATINIRSCDAGLTHLLAVA